MDSPNDNSPVNVLELAGMVSSPSQATVLLGQAKLLVRRGLAVVPDDRPESRSALQSIASWLQFEIETLQELAAQE